ncbi:MAG: hypothetical protein M4579_003754 [Chaenotheca gracillima]|nr:MAG: hypothetical protein M4579_003754 [Chaenotheca gracillima]
MNGTKVPALRDAGPTITAMQLSPLDQIMPRMYTHLLFFFPLDSSSDRKLVINHLSDSLQSTVSELPFLAGEIVPKRDTKQKGLSEIRPAAYPKLQVKDLADTPNGKDWNFQQLRDQHFPVSRLSGDIFAPWFGPVDPDEPLTVMGAQATFMDGGFVLCATIHHLVRDAQGIMNIMRVWARHCRKLDEELTPSSEGGIDNIPVTPEDLDRGGFDKGPPAPKIQGHPEFKIRPDPASAPPSTSAPQPMPALEVQLLYFSQSALAELKAAASLTKTEDAKPKTDVSVWISTNDALASLLWSSITCARFPSNESGSTNPSTISKLGVAVNGRSRLNPPLPPSYIGNAIIYATTSLPVEAIKAAAVSAPLELSPTSPLNSLPQSPRPLSTLALAIRSAINKVDDAHIRSTVALVNSLDDVSRLMANFDNFLGPGLIFTSWADLPIYSLDFGKTIGGGKPERVRVPATAFDGLCVALPRLPNGGLEVLVGLQSEHMERLKHMHSFNRWAEWRCS